jgi:hypothetical protein
MVAITRGKAPTIQLTTLVLRTIVVALTLATAQIHASLGGLMFPVPSLGIAGSFGSRSWVSPP